MNTTEERRYQMVRLRAGDYLLPSNDGKVLWRIYSYEEDGSAEYQDADGEWYPVLGSWWGYAYWNSIPGRPSKPDLDRVTDEEILDWGNWTVYETGLRTRRDAIKAALK